MRGTSLKNRSALRVVRIVAATVLAFAATALIPGDSTLAASADAAGVGCASAQRVA